MSGVSHESQQPRFGDQTFSVPKVDGVATSKVEDILIAVEPGFGVALAMYRQTGESSSKKIERGVIRRVVGSINSALDKLNPPSGYYAPYESILSGGLMDPSLPPVRPQKPPKPKSENPAADVGK